MAVIGGLGCPGALLVIKDRLRPPRYYQNITLTIPGKRADRSRTRSHGQSSIIEVTCGSGVCLIVTPNYYFTSIHGGVLKLRSSGYREANVSGYLFSNTCHPLCSACFSKKFPSVIGGATSESIPKRFLCGVATQRGAVECIF
jgi:hypothetical protein